MWRRVGERATRSPKRAVSSSSHVKLFLSFNHVLVSVFLEAEAHRAGKCLQEGG